MHIGRAGKCVDDDYDDSGGQKQRDCLSLAAPGRRVSSQTEAKTNTVNKTSFKAQFQPDIVSMKTMTTLVVGRNATVRLKPLPTAR